MQTEALKFLERCRRRFGSVDPRSQPTLSSLRAIAERLAFCVPRDFVDFAKLCPAYASWFVSIGEDFENPVHILRMNEEYHDPSILKLPSDLVLINHAYDGDLTCYDLSRRDEKDRFSICYCEALESLMPAFEDKRHHRAYTIADYLVPHLDFWERNKKKK